MTQETEIPAVSISVDTTESADTCREVTIDKEMVGGPAMSRSLTLGSSSSCRTRLTLAGCGASSSSRGSVRAGDTNYNGYGVRTEVWCHVQCHVTVWCHVQCHVTSLAPALFCVGELCEQIIKVGQNCCLLSASLGHIYVSSFVGNNETLYIIQIQYIYIYIIHYTIHTLWQDLYAEFNEHTHQIINQLDGFL